MKKITRAEAKSQGLKYYFTGKPCNHGHISKRKTHSGCCYECSLIYARMRYDSEKACARYKAYYEMEKDKIKARAREYHKENREKRLKYSREWYAKNREDQIRVALKRKKENPEMNSAWSSAYRSRKIKAIPSWFEVEMVNEVYEMAGKLGMHVDHIVPLQSEIVCGLHCWDNLQLLHSSENASKGNRHWPDMP